MKHKQLNSYQYAKQVWWFTSLKNNNTQWCESLLERDYLLSLEFDDSVDRYLSQPISITYQGTKRYTPDTLIHRVDQYQLIEVKPKDFVNEKLNAKLRQINNHLRRSKSPQLNLVTDTQIRVGERIPNLKRLYRYKSINKERCYDSPILGEITKGIIYRDLIELAKGMKEPTTMPLALLSHQILDFNMTKALRPSTYLEVNYA